MQTSGSKPFAACCHVANSAACSQYHWWSILSFHSNNCNCLPGPLQW